MLFRVVAATKFSVVARSAAQYNIPGITRICQRQYESITYSGGQANVGQGGFYGSGGARASLAPGSEQKIGMIAMAADVQKIESTMEELEKLEAMERSMSKEGISGRTIEIRGLIKKLMTNPEVVQCLKRLEVKGEPVWGLSSAERDLIRLAREKMNNC